MSHGNTVVDGNGIELSGIEAHFLYFFTDNLTDFMQVCMTRHKLSERIDNGNNRFAELLAFHTCGHPECSGTSHASALCTYCTT